MRHRMTKITANRDKNSLLKQIAFNAPLTAPQADMLDANRSVQSATLPAESRVPSLSTL